MSRAGDSENDNEGVKENYIPPRPAATKKLEEAISANLTLALYSSEHRLEMPTLQNETTLSRKPNYRL